MKVQLVRVEQSEHGTFGVLKIEGVAFCVTLEPEDRSNQVLVSCIPAGAYICERIASPKFGETFEITDVRGRSHILFHAGNTKTDTQGCIMLAQYFGKLRGDRAILNSGHTFREFMAELTGRDRFLLAISESGA